MQDKFPLYVGMIVHVEYLNQFSAIQVFREARLMDRKLIGVDVDNKLRYSYRLDVGNVMIELWIADEMLARFAGL